MVPKSKIHNQTKRIHLLYDKLLGVPLNQVAHPIKTNIKVLLQIKGT